MNIEIFSCSGGLGEGMRRAGIHAHMVIDKDTNACSSYERNLGNLLGSACRSSGPTGSG